MSKLFKIKHEDLLKIFGHLDQLPYKYVKELIPFMESVLQEVTDEHEKEKNTEEIRK